MNEQDTFIVYFMDSGDWTLDDCGGNVVVMPRGVAPDETWRKVMEDEGDPDGRKLPRISVAQMIQALKDGGLWDDLTYQAQVASMDGA